MFRKVHVQYIHLAGNEWGSDLMQRIAREWLVMHTYLISDDEQILCCVHEHAGWGLSWTMNRAGDMMCVGSANDMACYHGEAFRWRENAYASKREHFDTIRRPVEPVTYNDIVLPTTSLVGV